MEKRLTKTQAMGFCQALVFKGSASQYNELQRKLQHLQTTLRIGKTIVPNADEALCCALLLHDIGSLAFPGHANHAELGYQWLINAGVCQPNILLPVRYHESDLDWEDKLALDGFYSSSTPELQQIIRFYCEIVREADVIANMEWLNTIQLQMTKANPVLLQRLVNNQIGRPQDVHNSVDSILYILCGLSLIHQPESRKYLRKTRLVSKLIYKIRDEAPDSICPDDWYLLLKKMKRTEFW